MLLMLTVVRFADVSHAYSGNNPNYFPITYTTAGPLLPGHFEQAFLTIEHLCRQQATAVISLMDVQVLPLKKCYLTTFSISLALMFSWVKSAATSLAHREYSVYLDRNRTHFYKYALHVFNAYSLHVTFSYNSGLLGL